MSNHTTLVEKMIYVCFALIFFTPVIYGALYLSSATEENIKVEEKYTIAQSEGHRYMIHANEEVFENTDSLMFMKFNSADVHASLREGNCYETRVAGWRIHILSMNRNILNATEVECSDVQN